MAAVQYVFVMQNLTKVFPGGKELFKGITLSFLPGAKSAFSVSTAPVSRLC